MRPYLDTFPTHGERVYIDPAATVIGDVNLGDDVSVWPGCVIRGDVNSIRIGARTNVQDGTIVHVTHEGPFTRPGGLPTVIANDVTIGHGAIIHACTIGDECLIGMGSIIMDDVVIEKHVMVGAGSLVSPGKVLKSGGLYLGRPARRVRDLTADEIAYLRYSAEHYVRVKNNYQATPPRA